MSSKDHTWGTVIKLLFYTGDVTSDWANGIMMLAGEANSTLSNSTDLCEQDGGGFHPAWGGMSIAFSWIPALPGFLYLVCEAICEDHVIIMCLLSLLLSLVRFILWPFLVPIGMVYTGILHKDVPAWVFGFGPSYKGVMAFKMAEGLFEAPPQLILQLYIVLRTGMCLQKPNDIVQAVSMVFSLVTIHMTTCDAIILLGGETDLTTVKRVLYYIKMAPVIVPNIAFKTCTLAFTFVALRAFGLIIPLVFALILYMCIYDREEVDEFGEVCTYQCMSFFILAPPNIFTLWLLTKSDTETMMHGTNKVATWAGFILYSGVLATIYVLNRFNPGMTYFQEDVQWWARDPQYVLPILMTLGAVSNILSEIYIRYKIHLSFGENDPEGGEEMQEVSN